MKIEQVTLVGQLMRLVPLQQAHAAALCEASRKDPDLWQYMPVRMSETIQLLK